MRRIDIAHPLAAAEVDDLAVREHARSAICHVVERDHAAGLTMRRLRVWRDRQPLVHRAAFVGLIVAKGDPAQAPGLDQAAHGVAVEREHLPQAGVKHQRLVA